MDRSWGPFGPGTYTVRVFYKPNPSGVYFGVYGYELTVERVKA